MCQQIINRSCDQPVFFKSVKVKKDWVWSCWTWGCTWTQPRLRLRLVLPIQHQRGILNSNIFHIIQLWLTSGMIHYKKIVGVMITESGNPFFLVAGDTRNESQHVPRACFCRQFWFTVDIGVRMDFCPKKFPAHSPGALFNRRSVYDFFHSLKPGSLDMYDVSWNNFLGSIQGFCCCRNTHLLSYIIWWKIADQGPENVPRWRCLT